MKWLTLPLLALAAASAVAEDHGSERYSTNVPPPAELTYAIRAKQNGFNVDGEAHLRWSSGEGKYSVANETRAMIVGKILENKSEGTLDDYGLAPALFTEKRFRRDATTTTFARDSKTISFSASAETYAIKGGEQDRSSAVWQLIAVARANAAKFKPGSEWRFFVAGQRDAEPWTFRVLKAEKVNTVLGELDCLRILKAPPPDQKGQQIEIWLAPSQDWYPARIRYTDPEGDFIEQTLVSIAKR